MTTQGEHHGSEHGQRTRSRARMLFGTPVLLQDWDKESEHAFQYWELFLDLLLVAAASSVTDQFKENLSLHGFGEFAVFYFILVNGWFLYTHITTRYHDNSLAHSMVLFFYIYGFGLAMVNTGYHDVQAFCWGAILQRASMLLMLTWLTWTIPRSTYTNVGLGLVTLVAIVLLLVVALNKGKNIEESPMIMGVFWCVAILEIMGETLMGKIVEGQRLVPVNIEQTDERLGAMELACLGETVLSVTIIYRDMLSKGEIGDHGEGELENHVSTRASTPKHAYYWVLGFSFLLIYMFLLLYFHMQPSPADHALRRSRLHGRLILVSHKILGLAFLSVGVSVKLVVECLLVGEELPAFATQLMGYGVGCSILNLFFMRVLHYGGRDCVNFDTLAMHFGEDPRLDRVAMLWWWTIGLTALVPFIGVATGFTEKFIEDPLVLTAAHAGLVFFIVVAETFFAHFIQDQLSRKKAATTDAGENAILTKGHAEYDSIRE